MATGGCEGRHETWPRWHAMRDEAASRSRAPARLRALQRGAVPAHGRHRATGPSAGVDGTFRVACPHVFTEHPRDHDGRRAVPAPLRGRVAGALPPGAARGAPVHPGRRPRVPPPLRGVDRLPPEPDHAVHGPVPLPARRDEHRRDGEAEQRPRHGLAGPQLGAHPRRLVPGRRLRDALPGKVAHLARGPVDPRHPRGPHGLRCRGEADRRGGRRLPGGGPAGPLRLLRLDRPRAARCQQGRLRQRARRRLRGAGHRALRRAGRGAPRRPLAGRGLLRQPARHRLQRGGVGAAARLRARGRRHAARHPRAALAVGLVRRIAPPARRRSWPPGPPCSTSSRRTTPTAGSTTTCTRWSTGPSAGSSRRSTPRAWPRTPSSCSPRTTATSWVPTAASCRSGTTPTTRPSGFRSW